MKRQLLIYRSRINTRPVLPYIPKRQDLRCGDRLLTIKGVKEVREGKHVFNRNLTLLLFILLSTTQVHAQELATFHVKIEKDMLDVPISIPLENINYNTDHKELVLYEITQNGENIVQSQMETGHTAKLWFLLTGSYGINNSRSFVLKADNDEMTDAVAATISKNQEDLNLNMDGTPVLNYRYTTTLAPDGANPLFSRSGYIHPLWSPEGEILTRIQPPDHYHHYGIWGPWTKTHIGEREVDFWNLAKGQGTVKFVEFLSESEGPVYSAFKVLQQHIDFGAKGEDQVAINEILEIRFWKTNKNTWVIDYTKSINSPLAEGIMLDAYRYGGGLGFRATEKWHKNNCSVLTSEGKKREDADGTNARWCMVEGETDTQTGRSGVLFLSHPANRMHPEPMRVWPFDANGGRGDMFFEFTPIRHHSWKIHPKQTYTLKYRMIVFDGEMNAKTAEKYWNSFAFPVNIDFNN